MPFHEIRRNEYVNPFGGGEAIVTGGPVEDDFLDFHIPEQQVHLAHLHGYGVIDGLNVVGANGASVITVQSGAAIDRNGRLVVLADGGEGYIGADPIMAGPTDGTPVPVAMPLDGLTSPTSYLTLRFSDYRSGQGGPSGGFKLIQRPWLRLQDAFDPAGADADAVLLAVVGVDTANGLLTSLDMATSDGSLQRQIIAPSVGGVEVRRPLADTDTVSAATAGRLSAEAGGVMALTVPSEADGLRLGADTGAADGIVLEANDVVIRNADGEAVYSLDAATAELLLGTNGAAGRLVVADSNGAPGVTLDGATGGATFQGTIEAERLRLTDSSNAVRVDLSGQSGMATMGSARLGTGGEAGDLSLRNAAGATRVSFNGETGAGSLRSATVGASGQAGTLDVKNASNATAISLHGQSATVTAGTVFTNSLTVRDTSNRSSIVLSNSGTGTFGTNGRNGAVEVRDSGNRQAIRLTGSDGTGAFGTSGRNGAVEVRDSSNREAIRLTGSNGTVTIGTSGRNGTLNVRNSSNQTRVQLQSDGDIVATRSYFGGNSVLGTGNLYVRNSSGAYQHQFIGGSGNAYHEGSCYVDGIVRAQGWDIHGNAARKVYTRSMYVDNGTKYYEINLGSTRQIFATVVMTGCDPRHKFDSGDCFALDIYRIDGVLTSSWLSGGAHFGSWNTATNVKRQTFNGRARRVQFRIRSWQDATVMGVGLVFFE